MKNDMNSAFLATFDQQGDQNEEVSKTQKKFMKPDLEPVTPVLCAEYFKTFVVL